MDVVHERLRPVHLDDRDPLAIPRLELRIARDVHLVEVERRARPDALELAARGFAEVAAARRVQPDLRAGDYG